jgi:hypothetical protein
MRFIFEGWVLVGARVSGVATERVGGRRRVALGVLKGGRGKLGIR